MEVLSDWQLLFCALVVTLAFAVRGGTGFGGGAIAVPLLALVFPLQVTVPVVTVLNMLSSIGQGIADWRHIVWRAVWHIMPGSLIGVLIGLYMLGLFDPQPLGRALGVFVVLYALYVLLLAGREVHVPRRWLPVHSADQHFGRAYWRPFRRCCGADVCDLPQWIATGARCFSRHDYFDHAFSGGDTSGGVCRARPL